MPNFGPEAADVDDGEEVTFDDLFADVERIVTRIKKELLNRRLLDALEERAEDVIPGEFHIFVEFQDSTFAIPPELLGITSLEPLVDPMRQGGADNTVFLVGKLTEASQALLGHCAPAPAGGQDHEHHDPAGNSAATVPTGHPGGILAALQRARARTDQSQPEQP
jgi:hypothetical protein